MYVRLYIKCIYKYVSLKVMVYCFHLRIRANTVSANILIIAHIAVAARGAEAVAGPGAPPRIDIALATLARQSLTTLIMRTTAGTKAVIRPEAVPGIETAVAVVARQTVTALVVISAAPGAGAVALPAAVVVVGCGRIRGRDGRAAATSSGGRDGATAGGDPGNQTVADGLDAVLELGLGVGVPLGAVLAGNGVVAGKGNVQHVVGVVARVAGHAGAEAGGREGQGGLADHGPVLVAVGVGPDAVELKRASQWLSKGKDI